MSSVPVTVTPADTEHASPLGVVAIDVRAEEIGLLYRNAMVSQLVVLIAAPTAATWFYRDAIRARLGKLTLEPIVVGLIVGALWIATQPVGMSTLGWWLDAQGLAAAGTWLALRVFGFALIVPIAEELVFRGYLHSAFASRRFETAPAAFAWLPFLATSLLFGALHGRWLAGALAGAAFAFTLYRSKSLTGPIAAHIAANGLIAAFVLIAGRWESLRALAALVDDMASANPELTLRNVVAELNSRAESRHPPTVQGVTLSSLHAAKGLEWDAVFLVGLTDGSLPISQAIDAGFDAIEEERRLFYVGVTRAEQRLFLVYAAERTLYGERREQMRSCFLDDIPPHLLTLSQSQLAGGSRSGDGAFITNNPALDYHNPSQHGIAWERPISAELIQPHPSMSELFGETVIALTGRSLH